MNTSDLQFAKRFDGISGSAIREIFKMLAIPGMISFAGGNPSPDSLPYAECAEFARDLLLENGKTLLQYGATEGYGPLRESLVGYIRSQFGVEASEAEILPTTGSTQGMDLLCKAFIDPGDVILVEDPTFLGNVQSMNLYQARLEPIPSENGGINVERMEEMIRTLHPKIIYLIPTFQNPTGNTISLEKRRRVAELAGKYGVVIAEDDPYRDLRYRGEALPSIKSFDKSGFVVLLGSFSKVISPGLRVGFMCADPVILRKCVIGKQSADIHTALLNQAIVDRYLRMGLLPAHVNEICEKYAVQMHTMLDCLAECAGIQKYTKPDGGLFIFAELREGMNAKDLLMRTVERGAAYVPGTHFYVRGGHENTLRLNFSMSSPEVIRRGMGILNDVFAECAR